MYCVKKRSNIAIMLQTKKNPKHKPINSQYKSYLTYNESTCNGIKNISIYVHKARAKKRKKYKVYTCNQRAPSKSKQKLNGKSFSLAALSTHNLKLYVAHSGSMIKKSYQQNDPNYFTDLALKRSLSNLDFSKNPFIQAKWTVYRGQMSTKEEMWCCSCNSDSIFEVTKSLYDSYKKVNCARKSLVDIGVAIPSDAEKIEKSKKALSDMLGKSGLEKKKILSDLAMTDIPYPGPKTLSVVDLHKQVKRDLGQPPEPDIPADEAKLIKYEHLGIGVIPLEGKTPQQTEKIHRCLTEKGIQLTEGRMPSDKDRIRKRQLSIGRPPPPLPFKIESENFRNVKINTDKKIKVSKSLVPSCVPTEKLREAKPTGALSPLEGKSPEQKDKILRELAKRGIILPGKAPIENKRIDEVRGDISLPRKPQISSTEKRNAIAQNAGLIVAPLERKTPAQTEKNPPPPKDEPPGITTDLIRKDKPAGLLTPLEGKTSEQKDKVLRGSAEAIFPLQEDKSPSDKAHVRIIKSEFKIPEHTATGQMRKARAASLIIPLKGKTPAQKHKILRGLTVSGLRLPEETMKKAQTVGLLTPLIGKSLEQKQKALSARLAGGITPESTTPSEKVIIKELAEAKTPSQRSLANKIRNELGLPHEPKTLKKKSDKPMVQKFKPVTSSEKEIIQKAKANCFVTHFTGKIKESNIKERIHKERLADADLPLPVGATSENSLVKKVRADAGILLESTFSQKRGDIKAKAKNTGAGNAVKGISTEFEDIVKTTTCDRGCGRDKKKIRFMNSSIKIKVTSPDLSSICVCPDKCFQGIKGGITTNKEEIQVTCLGAVGISSYNKELTNSRKPEKQTTFLSKILPETDDRCISTDSTQSLLYTIEKINKSTNPRIESYNTKIYPKGEKIGFNYETNYHVNESFKLYSPYNTQSDQKNIHSGETSTPAICEDLTEDSEGLDTSIRSFTGSTIPVSRVLTRDYSLSDTYSSISSIRIDSSLKLSTSSSLSDVFRACLMSSNNVSTESVPFVCRHLSNTMCNKASCPETYTSDSHERINKVIYLKEKIKQLNTKKHQNECLIFKVTQSKVNYKDNKRRNVEPLVIINDLKNNIDLVKLADELLSNREFSDTLLFLVIPSSEEDNIESSPGLNSTFFLQEPETDYELGILVRILSSIRTIPTEQYHDEQSSKEYSTEISSSTVNDNNKSQNPSSSTNCIKPSKNHKKIIIIKNKPTKKISNTSTRQEIYEKKTRKNSQVTSTSTSSPNRRPKRGYIKWTTRSASNDRQTQKPLKKECLTADNNKPCNVAQPCNVVQTLFKSVKPRSHKRCQVSVKRMKANRKGANTNDRKDGDNKLYYNPTAENDINKNKTSVFRL